MSTNDYIRNAAKKDGWKKYLMLLRPVSIGTCPRSGMMDFINYDNCTEVNGIMAWAEVYYNRELTEKELRDFEMVRG